MLNPGRISQTAIMDVPAELVRSTEFWFEDGTVVLRVENTLYRVYRGLLASRSTVFHDTFSIPQPAEEREEIDGCPVLQLHDKEEDFTWFLKAFHHRGSQLVPSYRWAQALTYRPTVKAARSLIRRGRPD